MSKRDRYRHGENSPLPAPAPEAVVNAEPASVPEASAKPVRADLVKVRALQNVLCAGLSYGPGEEFVAHESKVAPLLAKGRVERVS